MADYEKDLIYNVRLNSTEAKSGLKALASEVQRITGVNISGISASLGNITSMSKAANISVKGLTAGFTGLAAAAAVVSRTVKNAAIGDNIKDAAQMAGMATAAYQEWGYVLQQNGLSIESLTEATRIFNTRLAQGKETVTKYGLTTASTFEDAIYYCQGLTDESEKLAVATDLFGRNASRLMPVLNMNNEDTKALMATYRAIGGTMSDELIAKSDVLSDSILELKSAWQGLSNAVTGIFMPALTAVVQELTMAVAKVTLFIKAILKVKETFGAASDSSSSISDGLEASVGSAKELKRTLMGFDELNVLQDNSSSSGGSISGITGKTDITGGSGITGDSLTELQKFNEWLDKNAGKVALNIGVITAAVLAFTSSLGLTKVTAFISVLAGFVGAIIAVNNAIDIWAEGMNSDNLLGYLGGAVMLIASLNALFGPMVTGIATVVASIALFILSIQDITENGVNAVNVIGLLISATGVLVATFLAFGAPATVVVGAIMGIIAIASTLGGEWDNMCKHMGLAFTGLKNVIEGIMTGDMSKIAEGFGQIWTGIFNTVIDVAEGFINAIISGINKAIDALNSFLKTAAKETESASGRKYSGNAGTIPHLGGVTLPRIGEKKFKGQTGTAGYANGAVLTTPTWGLMAEYPGAKVNPEVVTPQNIMRETFEGVLNESMNNVLAAIERNTTVTQNKSTDMYIDGSKMTRKITNIQQQQSTTNLPQMIFG